MVLSRTPFRISFFGGGTDYPAWYENKQGAVLSTTIDKYCYIYCRYLPPFFKHKYRVVWSKMENVRSIEKIEHPAVRAALQYLNFTEGLEVHHMGDLPARAGLGSSSSFAVGILNAMYTLKNIRTSKMQLAMEAIRLERDILKENVGSQDQVSVALGGLNKIIFKKNDSIKVAKINLPQSRLDELQEHLMLVYTGLPRTASDIAAEQIKNTPGKIIELETMYHMVDEGISILRSNGDINDFGKLLNETWMLKKSLSCKISNPLIDSLYETARKNGAVGGKLLGAGGAGFMLFFADKRSQLKIKMSFKKFLHVPFKFENLGSVVTFNGGEC